MVTPRPSHQLPGRPTRRAVLAGALAAPAVWRHPARPWPLAAFQVGVVGCGIRARELLNGHFLPNARFRVVEVCEVLPERLAHFVGIVDGHYGATGCRSTARHEELVARDDIDGVVIATPDHWHTLQSIAACRAKKHVYCEKPLTRTLAESKRIIDEVRRAGVTFQTGSQQRTEYGHRFVEAVERVRAGAIGKVLTVHVGVGNPPVPCDLPAEACSLEEARAFDRWLGPAPARAFSETLMPRGMHRHYPAWRNYQEYAGGGLADMGAHHFDIAQWALDRDTSGPVQVEPPADAAAVRGASLVFDDGVRIVHGGPSGVTFVGTDAVLHVDRHRGGSVPDEVQRAPLPEGALTFPRPKDHAVDWLDALETGGTPACPAETGARTAALCHLLNLVYRHRRPLTWDPSAWTFVDDAEADGWRDEPAREGYTLPD
jgi:predicted dehydrogenase